MGVLDGWEEVDSVAGSAEHSAFWLTKHGDGKRAIPEVGGDC